MGVKVPIRKKSGNLFNDPRIYIYIYIYFVIIYILIFSVDIYSYISYSHTYVSFIDT